MILYMYHLHPHGLLVQELRWCLLGTVILILVVVCLFFVSRTVAQLQGHRWNQAVDLCEKLTVFGEHASNILSFWCWVWAFLDIFATCPAFFSSQTTQLLLLKVPVHRLSKVADLHHTVPWPWSMVGNKAYGLLGGSPSWNLPTSKCGRWKLLASWGNPSRACVTWMTLLCSFQHLVRCSAGVWAESSWYQKREGNFWTWISWCDPNQGMWQRRDLHCLISCLVDLQIHVI